MLIRIIRNRVFQIVFGAGCVVAAIVLFNDNWYPANNVKVNPAVVQAHNKFAYRLFKTMLKENKGQNLLVCPVNISMGLAVALNGARGETHETLMKLIGVPGMSDEQLNAANSDILRSLNRCDRRVRLSTSSLVTVQDGIKLFPEFERVVRQKYRADVMSLNYRSPDAASKMNSWVSSQTNGEIRDLVKEIDPDALMDLLSVVRFEGGWTTVFRKEDTHDGKFTKQDGSQETLPMMFLENKKFRYSTEMVNGWPVHVMRMPYGTGRVSMYVIVPIAKDRIDDFFPSKPGASPPALSGIDLEKIGFLAHGSSYDEVEITMPRFDLNCTTHGKDVLQTMGLGSIFDPTHADFARTAQYLSDKAWIGCIDQDCGLRVNEAGTIVISAERQSWVSAAFPDIRMDRPFLFIIRDDKTGLILFMGAVFDPKKPAS